MLAEGGALLALEGDAERVNILAREILGDGHRRYELVRVEVRDEAAEVFVKAEINGIDGPVHLEGTGVGIVDAFFESLLKAFGDEYPSLKTIEIADFQLGSGFDNARGRRSDADADAVFTVKNSEGSEFRFRARSPSVTRSTVLAALGAITFFINSERAYVQLHRALQDAKSRRRSDLVERFRGQMATLVSATSYSEVIERLRSEEG